MTGSSKKSPCVNRRFIKSLKKLLGFKPKDINYYVLAFTHKSADFNECYEVSLQNNERLEFLGDAILDAVISELLYKRFPTANEGFLTQMRTKIVNGKKLTELAKKLNINKLLFVKSEKSISERIYEDAFEALIGAIYLDRGFKYAKQFVSQKIMVEHIDLNKLKFVDTNYKSRIIEWSQKHKIEIEFCTDFISEVSKDFNSQLKINGKIIGEGKAYSKKEAEQFASKQALEKIKEGSFNLKP
ncbi:MAG: ribonuclease III [Bacteroidales bacterium]|nr:ribonuclease III [Bacteroidales bacterium]